MSAALRAALGRALLIACLLGVQWAAAGHAASHLSAGFNHAGDPGEALVHPACMDCLAFHPLDGGIPPSVRPVCPAARPVAVPAWTPCARPVFAVASPNCRAPPFLL